MNCSRSLIGLLLVGVVLLLLIPGAGAWSSPAPPVILATSGALDPAAGTSLTLQLNNSSIELNQSFWGTTLSARAPIFTNESALVNATPTRVVLWPGAFASDDYDPFNNILYRSATNTRIAPSSEAEFVSWCKAINCTAIFELPGEIDNASFAAQVVEYTEQNLSFHPAYWEMGNEPAYWGYWGKMWQNWTSGTTGPTPIQYAWEELNYTTAIRSIDPSFKLIGLPGVGGTRFGTLQQWVNATIQLDGPNLSGIAVHVYPDVSGSTNSLATFYGTLNTSNYNSIPTRTPALEGYIRTALEYSPSCYEFGCPTSLPIMFTELGSAISGRPDGKEYSEGFAGGLFMDAEIVQSFAQNITSTEVFAAVLDTANSWYTISGEPHPLYTMYSDILSHLGNVVHTVNLSSAVAAVTGNVYATSTLAPADGNREDLMVVNTNVGTNISFAPVLPEYRVGTAVQVWQWNGTLIPGDNGPTVIPASTAPFTEFFPNGLPTNWTLPEQSVAVFESRPGGGAPVQLTESGLPNGTRWFVGVGNTTGTSDSPEITLFLRPGAYATIPGPADGIPGHLTTERFAPGPSVRFALPVQGINVAMPYFLQYALHLSVTPLAGGTIGPTQEWADANATVTLTATPSSGYGFEAWFGWGNGSYNGSRNPATFALLDPIHETAIFGVGYAVTFVETGLLPGTAWSVTVRGTLLTGIGPTIATQETNGTFGYQVSSVVGYTVQPTSSFFNVSGANLSVTLTFKAIPVLYSVTFSESGLPTGRAWSVTIRNTTYFRSTPNLIFPEYDGTYGFRVTNVTGFTTHPASGSFSVDGANVSVELDFVPLPFFYPVAWQESGLPNGTLWSVTVRAAQSTTTGSEIVLVEQNGSYTYEFSPVTGYRATPPEGGFTVDGAGVTLEVRWNPLPPARYSVTFWAGSLPPGARWSVSFAGLNATSTNGSLEFTVTNGTFHFGVTPPAGHYVSPGGGTVVVAGSPETVAITFGLPDPPPPPSEVTELSRALAVVGVIALVGVATFLVFSRRDRSEGTAWTTPVAPVPEYVEEAGSPNPNGTPDYHEDAFPH